GRARAFRRGERRRSGTAKPRARGQPVLGRLVGGFSELERERGRVPSGASNALALLLSLLRGSFRRALRGAFRRCGWLRTGCRGLRTGCRGLGALGAGGRGCRGFG